MDIHKLIARYDVHKKLTNQCIEKSHFMGSHLLKEPY